MKDSFQTKNGCRLERGIAYCGSAGKDAAKI
jgi:hypothetical protein